MTALLGGLFMSNGEKEIIYHISREDTENRQSRSERACPPVSFLGV